MLEDKNTRNKNDIDVTPENLEKNIICLTLTSYINSTFIIPTLAQTSCRSAGGERICPSPTAVRFAVDLRPSANGSAVRTSLMAGQLQAASVPIGRDRQTTGHNNLYLTQTLTTYISLTTNPSFYRGVGVRQGRADVHGGQMSVDAH